MAEGGHEQVPELQLSGATHLLIRQMPPSSSQMPMDDFCGRTIPVLVQLSDNQQDGCNIEKPEVGLLHENTPSLAAPPPPSPSPPPQMPMHEKTATVSSLMELTSLEEFMDVVTTYKCKFCPFNCGWKSGLMSHIRNTHFEMAVHKSSVPAAAVSCKQTDAPMPNVSNVLTTLTNMATGSMVPTMLPAESAVEAEQVPPADLQQEDSEANVAQEKQIFLCGQCNQGFYSLELCKTHMIRDHHIKVEPEEIEPVEHKPRRKRSKLKRRARVVESMSHSSHGSEANENEEGFETSSKRKIRPPRALEEDYVLSRRRKRVRLENSDERKYRCNERGCGYRFKVETSLSYHERCHQAESKQFACPECDEKTDNWRYLSMHLWRVHNIDMDLHACGYCDYRTYSIFKLENHQRIHSEERAFICNTCGKGFKQLSQLRNHCVIHMDRKNMAEKRWYSEQECDICHRTFSDSKCLRKHLQAVHNKIKPFVCPYCGHTSARKAMLQLHMRQHTGEKPFQCDLCEYRTGDHNSMRRHKMRHSGKKPYKCPHCSYACIQAISYKTHLKNKHPGMGGLYACTLCAFRSVSKDNYVNHMADHKRGAIPSTDAIGVLQPASPTNSSNISQTENALPSNIAAAQLIYSCLNALSQEGGHGLPSGVSASSLTDGTQTITIQIPSNQDLSDAEQYYLAIQPPHELVDGTLQEMEGQQGQTSFTVTTASSVDAALRLAAGGTMSASDGISTVQLVAAENVKGGLENLPLVITQTEN